MFANGPGVLGSIESYQRLKKWCLMPPCLTLSILRYGSRVKWSNPGKGVAPSPTPWCSSYRKESLWVTFNYGHHLYLLYYSIACAAQQLETNSLNVTPPFLVLDDHVNSITAIDSNDPWGHYTSLELNGILTVSLTPLNG